MSSPLTGKKRSLPDSPHSIILNYGIEIECVFDIINNLNVYVLFLQIYFNKDNSAISLMYLDQYNIAFNLTLKKLFEFLISLKKKKHNLDDSIREKITRLESQEIYITLLNIFNGTTPTTFYDHFKEKYDQLVALSKDDSLSSQPSRYTTRPTRPTRSTRSTKSTISTRFATDKLQSIRDASIFIDNVTKFIIAVIDIIKDYIINSEDINTDDLKDHIFSLLDLLVFNKEFKDLKNLIKFGDNIILYDSEDVYRNSFYTESKRNSEKLHLLYIQDTSVVCDGKKVYKNVIDKVLSTYKILFDQCEFITEVFNTPDDIETKLDIFFSNKNIIDTLLNCEKTSNHVHISFNITEPSNTIIKPDIKIIIALLCICYKFQGNIFELFLKFRDENKYCMRLNYNSGEYNITLRDEYTDDQYDECIKVLFDVFYIDRQDFNIKLNRYFWLNIVNLFKIKNIKDRPPTVEFRIKHGSTDTEEMKNVCILYTNLINCAIELSSNIKSGEHKIKNIYIQISTYFDEKYNYETDILGKTKDFFMSNYKFSLAELNSQLGGIPQFLDKPYTPSAHTPLANTSSADLPSADTSSGDKMLFLNQKILELNSTKIYKFNSFGKQFIGFGLNDDLKISLEKFFNKKNSDYNNDALIEDFFKKYSLTIES